MKIKEVEKILFNPLFTSKLLMFALCGAKDNKLKLELIYYILPLLYDEQIKNKLAKSNSRSSFKTFFDSDVRKKMIGIEELLKNYNKKSKEALITLSNLYSIELNSYVLLKEKIQIQYSQEPNSLLKEYYKAAFNLGNILSKENYSKIFYSF
ncbi:three component ABC system middle component [Sphingobacterium siyangense]|uniref:three component ABC system middle component n=1 Tax=Sphingobacterium siyangense TaxID=459529 RepID=UPI003DA38EC4